MAAVRIRDEQLKTAMTELADAHASGNAAAAATAAQTVEARSEQLEKSEADNAKRQIFWVNLAAAVAGGIVVVIVLAITDPWNEAVGEKDTRQAWGWTALVAYLVYGGLGAIRWGDGGLLSFIRGKDRRLSTSLLQVGLWTVAVSSVLLYFIFLALYSDDAAATFKAALGGDNLPEEYLLLLGGPFAAAVVARLTVGSKVADQELQKVEANAKLIDVVADDDEQANLVDAQFLVFNLVALTWFVAALIDTPDTLPDIPDLLVGLTSTSALAYMGAKGVASNRPVVTSVTRFIEQVGGTPGPTRPGDVVEIRGMNFVPAGADSEALLRKIVVKFGDSDVSPHFLLDQNRVRSPSDTSIIAQVPENKAPGNVRVSVVTAAGIEAEPRDLTVVEDKPVLTGLDPPESRTGHQLMIRGRFFRRPGADADDRASVRFGSVVVEADEVDARTVVVTVPSNLSKGTVDVSVRAAGGTVWSDPLPLTVK